MAAIAAILDTERSDFSNSESLCHCNQVSAQSDLQFGMRRRLKNIKMATVSAIFDIGKERFERF